MAVTLRKELKIYRGTYAEIMAPEIVTEDMAIYFAWDTREIYVGNKLGVKVLYNGGENLTANQVIQLVDTHVGDILTQIRALLTQTNVNFIDLSNRVTAVENTVNSFNQTLATTVETKVNETMAAFEHDILGDLYYNKAETDQLVLANNNMLLGQVQTLRNDTYTKLEVETMIPDDYASGTEFDNFQTVVLPYLTVKLIPGEFSEAQVSSLLDIGVENGIFAITSSERGSYLIIKNGGEISRMTSSGIPETYANNIWAKSKDSTTVLMVNNIPAIDNNISLTADNIPNSETKKWNTLLPAGDGSINSLGRYGAEGIGTNSTSIGYNTFASGLNSVAYGYGARVSGLDSIQLGDGVNGSIGSLQIWGHKLLDKTTGHIPQERLGFMEQVIVISPEQWNSSTKKYAAEISGIQENSLIWVSPNTVSPSNYASYIEFEIRAVQQMLDRLVFECTEIPSVTISVNILWRI